MRQSTRSKCYAAGSKGAFVYIMRNTKQTKLTKKRLFTELVRLQRENAELKTLHKLDEGIFKMMENRLEFFQEMTRLTREEQDSLVPMARFLERLSKCLLLQEREEE